MPESAAARHVPKGNSFLLHLHAPKVHAATLHPMTTLGLGVAAVTLLAVLFATGLVLMFHYAPTAARAHGDVWDITEVVPFGALFRDVHRVATHLLLIITGLHLLRVLLCGAYRGTRRLNWVIGLCLLLIVVAFAFTGYLLPWDSIGFWACTVGAEMLALLPLAGKTLQALFVGGAEITEMSLLRFYVLHVMLLPTVISALLIYHLWRIRKDGGLARNTHRSGEHGALVDTWPHVVLREATWVVLWILLVIVLGFFVHAPLGEPIAFRAADHALKAPWYFVGLQEMVSYDAIQGAALFLLCLFVSLVMLPLCDRRTERTGLWCADTPAPVPILAALVGATAAAAGLWLWGSGCLRVAGWLDPTKCVVVAAVVCGVSAWYRVRGLHAAATSCLCASLAGYLVFTIVGALWRGPAWQLSSTWQLWLSRGGGL